jgi:NAD(P)-dependent dehydrogenase (short-subunit alcohol dehydrogenase family)
MAASVGAAVALVTGASRGLGKGIAAALGDAGYTVYVTARSSGTPTYPEAGGTIEATAALVDKRGGRGIAVQCDHADDHDVRRVFDQIRDEHGHLDVLVNNVWGGYAGWHERRFGEMLAPFWDKPFEMFDASFQTGVRAHFTSSALAVPLMGAGSLIVTVSFFAGSYPRPTDDVAYTMAKAADDRMMLAMAEALRERQITCLAVYPGLVSTELVVAQASEAGLDMTNAETPEFTGRVIVALARDEQRPRLSGAVVPVAELADHYGIDDINGGRPPSLRPDFERDVIAVPPWPPTG